MLSSIGQADDLGFLANKLMKLKLLLHLTVMYCDKYQVKLAASKVELATPTISVDGVELNLELNLNLNVGAAINM